MRALSIQQPWCSAIAYGPKRVENRSWPAPRWIVGQRIAVHASKGPDWHAPREAWTAAGTAPYVPGSPRAAWTASLPLGAIIAVATVAGCHDWHECMQWRGCSDWAASRQHHWLLADVRPLTGPVPCLKQREADARRKLKHAIRAYDVAQARLDELNALAELLMDASTVLDRDGYDPSALLPEELDALSEYGCTAPLGDRLYFTEEWVRLYAEVRGGGIEPVPVPALDPVAATQDPGGSAT